MSAAAYARGVLGFVAATAAPYFAQRASMEILNHLAHVDFSNAVERSLRIEASLADDGALTQILNLVGAAGVARCNDFCAAHTVGMAGDCVC